MLETTYVRIVPFGKNFVIRKEKFLILLLDLISDQISWGTKPTQFKTKNEATTCAQQQGLLILPEPPEGFTVTFDEGSATKYVVIAQNYVQARYWLNHEKTAWTDNPFNAGSMNYETAQAISDTYK